MNFLTSIARLFTRPLPAPTPTPKPIANGVPKVKAFVVPDASALAVSKAVEQIALIDRSYSLGIWPGTKKDDIKHDLSVMHAHHDLKYVCLQLLATDRTVLFEFKVSFNGNAGRANAPDSGGGVEVPLVDRRMVHGHRVIIQQGEKQSEYRRFLRLQWTTAETLNRRPGDTFESEHARKITGGRQHGQIHVGAEARHELLITQTGDRGFAFAKDLTIAADGIFVHAKFAPVGTTFRIGQRVRAIVVQTPKGLQARSIAV